MLVTELDKYNNAFRCSIDLCENCKMEHKYHRKDFTNDCYWCPPIAGRSYRHSELGTLSVNTINAVEKVIDKFVLDNQVDVHLSSHTIGLLAKLRTRITKELLNG